MPQIKGPCLQKQVCVIPTSVLATCSVLFYSVRVIWFILSCNIMG